MQIDPDIFRAYDIRGVVDRALTPEVVRAIGHALGVLYPGSPRVAVGRDGRLSSPALAEALCRGLADAGRTAIDIGAVPTPVLYFATHHLDTGAGVMITGSHNPPEYNGIKMVMDGHTLFGEEIRRIYERLVEGDLPRGQGRIESANVLDGYLQRITGDVKLARPMRIAIDTGNGVAGPTASRLFKALGCEVTCLYCDVDGRFPHHHPNPSELENVQDLIRAVREQGLEIGLAFDGDGDRLGVVDEQGKVIWADRQMMLFARDVLSRHPGATIIFDVKSSRHLAELIQREGGKPLMWKTGHSFIKAKMKETGALLAGEMSGHIFFKERWYGFDDGLYAGARLLEILSREDPPVSAVFARLPDAVSTPELNVHFEADGAQHEFMRAFAERARFEGAEVSRIDGIRADFPDGWGLVRASNTTPSLVIRFEADSRAALERIQAQFREQMHAVRPDLELPF